MKARSRPYGDRQVLGGGYQPIGAPADAARRSTRDAKGSDFSNTAITYLRPRHRVRRRAPRWQGARSR